VTPDDVTFDARGLVPAVVQEADTGELLMVAWMNREALDRTLATRLTHFWSRSRGQLWRKGETSGHSQHVSAVYLDCDADTLLVQVHQDGVACHTGNRTCFFRELEAPRESPSAPSREPASSVDRGERDEPRSGVPDTGRAEPAPGAEDAGARVVPGASAPAGMLGRLERIVAARKASAPAGSYVARLLAKGEATICRKVGEEAVEVVTAALGGEGDRRLIEEVADLWFHTMVLLGARSIPLADVLEELARRHGQRGISG
jgi:phosphoribosyl-AMP cyclohydrolase / phosphoribosyl-ATP pyrophosphohydrolase